HEVDGRVRVLRALLGPDDAVGQVHLHLDGGRVGSVLARVVRHDDAGVDDLVGGAIELGQLLLGVAAHGVGDLEGAADQLVDVHGAPFGRYRGRLRPRRV